MTDIIKTLAKLAKQVRGKSYAPYSSFHVGAALITDKGEVFSGTNVETANYKGLCAEASAIGAMVSSGKGRRIRDIAVIGPDDGSDALCTPCGDCRQRIREFSDAKTRIHVLRADGRLAKSYTMNDLLPDSFGPENLASTRKTFKK